MYALSYNGLSRDCQSANETVTGQFADKTTCSHSSRGVVSLQTSQVAEMFDGKLSST